ncbi:YbdD/YjiX family protein [Actinomyces sp. MRS3W]|uniref:YbdD/YjiX family protein n=1 Tax=Actinomyces sp. MRS3W TaxID=2800796 RepID=UPI0028FD05CE|nr:YbdD/YjiX family protein [Actinomyces sp. MRS3W]MDU0348225.1 YbdD/YjiX family protein [Actinomyces sp. MRS3W]
MTGASMIAAGRGVAAGPSSTSAAQRLPRLRAGLARALELWRDFTGESAYDRYVERHRREHPDHAPMSASQWWRARADFDERNVSTGCC